MYAHTIFSIKKSSQSEARNICHLVTIRIGMSKMAKSDKYKLFGRNIRGGGETSERFLRCVSRDKMVGFELS